MLILSLLQVFNVSLYAESAIEDHPDDYIWERAQRFGVSKSGIRAALVRLKITYKKKRYTIQKQALKKENNSSKK